MIASVRNVCIVLKQEMLINPVSWRFNSSLSKNVPLNSSSNLQVTEIEEEVLKEIQNPRNKSRLSLQDYNILHNKPPYRGTEPTESENLSLTFKREMFGKYGFESGVNPALCFHTKEEIQNIKQYERIAYDKTIQEMKQFAIEEEENKRIHIKNREKYMDEQMKLQEEWKQRIKARMDEKLAEALAAQESREKLIKEVRKQLGYNIEPTDPKFLEVIEQKEAELKKIKKQEKKKKREEFFLAKIAALEANTQGTAKDATNEIGTEDQDKTKV